MLQYRAIERWDGKLPVMQGGDKTPLLTFDVGKLAGNDAEREKKLRQMLNEEEAERESQGPGGQPDGAGGAGGSAGPAASAGQFCSEAMK